MTRYEYPSNARPFISCVVAALVCIGSGCEMLGLGDPPPPPTAPPTKVVKKKVEVAPVAAVPAGGEYQRPEYPNNSRRNPFQPDLEVVKPDRVQAEGTAEQLEPLERYALGELELVAIISEVAVPKAMFIDPEGFGHVLKEGDRLGKNSGVLSDIRDNEVEVTETTGDDQGQTRLRTIKLRAADLRVGDDSGLTEDEKAALEKLLSTDEGREALEERYRNMALGANAVEKQGSKSKPKPKKIDPRFQGLAPPSR